jgi:protein SCO1/2
MKRLPSLILFIMLSLTACGGSSFRGSMLDEPVDVPDFALTDENGGLFRLSDQQGNVVLLFFGYTSCPDVCPTTLATWRKVHEALGEDAERVRFVFVTVDPERDFIGLTGAPDELDPVYEAFDVYYEKDTSSGSALGYLINHTATTFVLDPQGRWRLRETYGTEAEDIVHDIRQLLD